eukprot:UN29960
MIQYLLEKVRVVSCMDQERNYHSFYQVVRGADDDLRKKLLLSGDPSDYRFLSGLDDAPGIDDVEEWEDIWKSLDTLGIPTKEFEDVFTLVAAILHLGNICFEDTGDKSCKIITQEPLQNASQLLQVDVDTLNTKLCHKLFQSKGSEDILMGLSASMARDNRDALAKFIYTKLFDWIVRRVNQALRVEGVVKRKTIGVLDIFGFEIFKDNSFEQLCINFTNEKLQQFFNQNTFKNEQKIYEAEEIDFKSISYVDNQPVLDVIEK